MANIKISVNHAIRDGFAFTFHTPCSCADVDGVVVEHSNGSDRFEFKDAHGNSLTDIGNLFAPGVLLKVILDVTNSSAYIQNADTNSYLENKFKSVMLSAADPDNDGHVVMTCGSVLSDTMPSAEGVEF